MMNKRELIDKLENHLANHGFDYRYTLDYFINDYNLWNKYFSNILKCVTGILYKFLNNDEGNVASFNTAKAVGFNYEGRIIQYIYGKHEMKHNFLLFL